MSSGWFNITEPPVGNKDHRIICHECVLPGKGLIAIIWKRSPEHVLPPLIEVRGWRRSVGTN